MDGKKLLCVVGPTACHKTETAVALAKRLHGEVISADSVQVYIGMDIGSAKPTLTERQSVAHHLIDCVPIDAPAFSVSQYKALATQAVEAVIARSKLPIVVGGSGLYVNALTAPLNFAVPSDPKLRARLDADYAASPERVYAQLCDCDPVTAARLHPNDRKRVVRALEVYRCSGRPLSSFGNDFANSAGKAAPYDAVMIGLRMDRALLYERIEQRVDCMLRDGLLAEVERIYRAGYPRQLPAMQSIGYRQLFDYLDGSCTLEEAVARIKQDTRRFAKRQLTWFCRDTRICWFDVTRYDAAVMQQIMEYAEERLQINHASDF